MGTPIITGAKASRASSLPSEPLDIYHPGYSFRPRIASFAAYANSHGVYGLPYAFIMDACYVLAHNRPGILRPWHSHNDVALDENLLLPAGKYTYHVNNDEPYPICVSFLAWVPPPKIPDRWTNIGSSTTTMPGVTKSTLSALVKAADSHQCVVTGATSALNNSHLIPGDSTSRTWVRGR
ncbi:hypothetical protein MIND_00067700 [Mycena indigotica]|uniref:HNH nuclease domain-containing protein n=1 Tax=Mycena indigotica TaxID=2126181 RepID=A0A8H6WEA7_9AGAR|nr:uncharacterized protein MIND_00067700 [Mycena indigotica]KAF7315524.1 hypothetical protein MIND_00067700 [Mycena indigotica]